MHFPGKLNPSPAYPVQAASLGIGKIMQAPPPPPPAIFISLLLQLWHYLLFKQLKIRVGASQVCHSCPSALPLAWPSCVWRPRSHLAFICIPCAVCFTFCFVRFCDFFLLSFMCEGVLPSKVWRDVSLKVLIYFFLMPCIHATPNPVVYLRSLNALTATIWGQAHWYICPETMESTNACYTAGVRWETAQLCDPCFPSAALWNTPVQPREEYDRTTWRQLHCYCLLSSR